MADDAPPPPGSLGRGRGQDWLILALGVWLFVSPWVLGDASFIVSSTNDWVVGALIFLVAAWALSWPYVPEIERINVALGVWLIASGFFMPATRAEQVDSVVVGIAVLLLALWAGASAPRRPMSA